MSKFPEYDDSYSSEVQYFDEVDKYIGNIKKKKYNMILRFLNRWMKGIVKLWKLTDFTHISQFNMPKDKHSRQILEEYADDTCEKLGIDYKFNKKNIEERHKGTGKSKNQSGVKNSSTKTILNAAHDNKYIYRSEMINLLRMMLKKIDYGLYSKRTDKCIVWWITQCKSCNTYNTTRNIKNNESLEIYGGNDIQYDSMTEYINKRYRGGRRLKRINSDDSENKSVEYSDSNDSNDSNDSSNSSD